MTAACVLRTVTDKIDSSLVASYASMQQRKNGAADTNCEPSGYLAACYSWGPGVCHVARNVSKAHCVMEEYCLIAVACKSSVYTG